MLCRVLTLTLVTAWISPVACGQAPEAGYEAGHVSLRTQNPNKRLEEDRELYGMPDCSAGRVFMVPDLRLHYASRQAVREPAISPAPENDLDVETVVPASQPSDTQAHSVDWSNDGDDWRFDLQLYAFLPAKVEGSATAWLTAPVDLSFGDIFSNLNAAGSVRFEGWKGDWGFIVDLLGAGVEADTKLGPVNLNVEVAQFIGDVGVGYCFGPYPLGDGDADQPKRQLPRLRLEPLGGLRYVWLKQRITPGCLSTIGGEKNYVEPWLGGRVVLELNDWLALMVRGDVGGFGLGNASDLTWSAMAGANFHVSKRTDIRLGYRIYDIDYQTGSGRDRFGVDLRMHGPWIGVAFRW